MSVAHYTARKVGDDYVMVRTDTPMGCEAPGWMLAGGALLVCGMMRRGVLGLACGALGGGLLYYGVTGKNPRQLLEALRQERFESGPTFQHDTAPAAQSVAQTPDDEVDEASMESFPASDAPARLRP